MATYVQNIPVVLLNDVECHFDIGELDGGLEPVLTQIAVALEGVNISLTTEEA